MTLKTVIAEVCAFVGVRPPSGSVIVQPQQDRTMWEMVQLANEMAQRIAYDTRDWQLFRKTSTFTGDGTTADWLLPVDMKRMLLEANVYRSKQPIIPLSYVSDPDEWLQYELNNWQPAIASGSWIISGNKMSIRPVLAAAETAKFLYLHKNCITLGSPNAGVLSDRFAGDDDVFNLPERLLKLGMIWQWKAYKGGTYAEDIANYEDALAMIAGADKPSPIIVGRTNLSTARQSYPYPTPTAPETPYP
jgi:hypothetical protein